MNTPRERPVPQPSQSGRIAAAIAAATVSALILAGCSVASAGSEAGASRAVITVLDVSIVEVAEFLDGGSLLSRT